MQPIVELSLPEDLSDSETVVTVVSPRLRASVATENVENAEASSDATKARARRSSAQKTLRLKGAFALPADSKRSHAVPKTVPLNSLL